MDFQQLWQNYKELILVTVTAIATLIATLLGQKVVPGLWHGLVKLFDKGRLAIGRRLSDSTFEKRYLEFLWEEHRYLRVRGIRTRSPVAIPLDEIYVSVTLSRRRHTSKGMLSWEGINRSLDELPTRLADPAGPEFSRIGDHGSEKMPLITLPNALQRYPKRLVILGGPGAGKTTMLTYLVLTFARGKTQEALGLKEERLPIIIRLRDIIRVGLSLTVDNLAALAISPDLAMQCPVGFFARHLELGNCIVLLDGMDEVTTEDERSSLADQISDLVHAYPDNRYIVTSRPAGYGGAALAGFTELDVCDFSDDDVAAFARSWCRALELAVREVDGEVSEAVAQREAEREASRLLDAISTNEHVRSLAVNPLLLTIIALVHRYRATLPQRRVELYDECTQVLLGYWDQAKGIAGQLDWARKRHVLETIAHWMHGRRLRDANTGDVEHIVAEALATVGERGERAPEFLCEVRDRSGLLVERGLGLYGFSHLTFQEYLTASYLSRRGESGLQELLSHIHDPWWLEVLLLYVGLGEATPAIRAIRNGPEDLFKNNLFLAARCLANVVSVDPGLESSILSVVVDQFVHPDFQGLGTRARQALVDFRSTSAAFNAANRLLVLLAQPEPTVRVSVTHILRELGEAEPAIVERLIALLADPEPEVRASAAVALGELDEAKPAVVERLIALLADPEPEVRANAVSALAGFGKAEPAVVECLLALLIGPESGAGFAVAIALGELGEAEPAVIERLTAFLADPESEVRASAAFALGALGEADPAIAERLIALLGDPASEVRVSASSALSGFDKAEPAVIDVLTRLLADPAVVERLIALLVDPESEVRSSVIAILELGETKPIAVERLTALLADPEPGVRARAANASAHFGEAEPAIIERLTALLADPESEVRASAAFALGELGEAEPMSVERLTGLLVDLEPGVRVSAANALTYLGKAGPAVIDVLTRLLADPEPQIRLDSAAAFRSLRSDPNTANMLLVALEAAEQPSLAAILFALDPNSQVPLGQDREPAIDASCIPRLVRLLRDSRLVLYSSLLEFLQSGRRVCDVAWDLLYAYNQRTGERIFPDAEAQP